ncbi:DUF3015 domain-containing protein [Pseudomonadota bacterium]
MKKTIISIALLSASSSVLAVAPGGSGCGWGNMLFEGQSGPAPHVLGATTNDALTGNATFGMTTGTNGCDTSGSLSYNGESLLASIMNEFSEDVARGEGEALNAIAVMYGVEQQDRASFASAMHANFQTIFPSEDVTAAEVMASMNEIMKADAKLAKYVA